MKLEPNIEIDRLLRRHARQSPAAPMAFAARKETGRDGEARSEPDGFAHLDADELSAYAENALPARTRTRYTEHLADCDSCRTLVTELVLSSGIAAQLEKQAAPPATTLPARSWRDWMAMIFAPTKLRYAASVLAVAGIAAIAFMVFRDGRPARFDTSESQPSQNTSAARNNNEPLAQNNQTDAGSNANSNSTPTTTGEPPKSGVVSESPSQPKETGPQTAETELQKSADTKAPVENPAPASAPNGDLVGQNRPQRDEDAEVNKAAQPNAPPPTVETGKNKKEIDGADTSEEAGRLSANRERSNSDKSAAAPENKTQYGKLEESAASRKARRGAESPPKDSPATSLSAGAGAASGATMDDRNEKADGTARPVEKRSVSGKQFVRRGGAWVDTAYKSQATTNVRRGSEQYRSLMADEPQLRDIANQLGGEVIVVLKGRAYRIR